MLDAKNFTYADPYDLPIRRAVIRGIEAVTGKPRLWRLYREYCRESGEPGAAFWETALCKLELTVDYDREQWAKIPRQGPLVVVANHPYGVLDGLILSSLISRMRNDYRVLTNSVLCKVDAVQDHVLPIDFSRSPEALRTNLATRKAARALLVEGGCIAVFPAGGVSAIPRFTAQRAEDRAWQPFIGRLIRDSGATVLPVFFDGQNSRLFQFFSLVSPTLRTALFFKEVADKIGGCVRVEIGDPIPFDQLSRIGDRTALCEELRRLTYAVGGIDSPKAPLPAYRLGR